MYAPPTSRGDLLVSAVLQGDLDTLERDVTPSNVNYSDGAHHLTLLLWAVTLGRLPTTQLLLSRGASLSAEDRHYFTVLHRAVWCGDAALVHAILYRSPNKGWREGAARLLERPHCLTGRTPLMLACIKGDLPTVRLLLEAGADPLRRDLQSVTAIEFAAMCGWANVVEYLTAVCGAERLTQRAEEYCEAASTVAQRTLLDDLNKQICRELAPSSVAASR